jgi:hypothetical protein
MKKSVPSEAPLSSKPAVSERKASANRANAQRSTGPRTAKGKAASSLNALRHGILARAAFNVSIEGEERRAEFDALVAGFAQEYQPRTITEYLTVQQLAGCYWRLAKVWTYEIEASWRARPIHNMGIVEHEQLERFGFGRATEKIINLQHEFFPEAGLGEVTIPLSASAATILRYQGAIQTMITRCLTILERRGKQRSASGEEFEEQDYTNEATETDAPATEAAPEAPASETSAEKSAEPATDAELHKRTQKDAADATLCSDARAKIEESPASTAENAVKSTLDKS